MNLSLKEIIKRIERLEHRKSEIWQDEMHSCIWTHGADSENGGFKPEYDFAAVRDEIKDIDAKTRSLRHALHLANATVVVEEYGMTLGECIIYMAQLGREKDTLEHLSRREPKTRRVTHGGAVEYTETLYNRKECREALAAMTDEIIRLQVLIDGKNLSHKVEVDID